LIQPSSQIMQLLRLAQITDIYLVLRGALVVNENSSRSPISNYN
jgi:hypothetical protein